MGLLGKLRSLPRNALLLLLSGLLLRIVFIAAHQRPLISDEKDYHNLAVSLATTAEYANNGVPTAYRPIAYPAFVALVYSISGEYPTIVKILQAVIDMLTALLLYLLLDNESGRIQTAALALWCFYLPAILYTNLLITETLFTFLLVLCCYLVVRYRFQTSLNAFLIGVVLGLLILIKSGAVLLVLACAVIMYFSRIALARYTYIAAGAILALAPWLVRNHIVLGKPALSTSGGINLLIGNNPNANGSYTLNFPREIFAETNSELEADEAAYHYAVQYIMNNPGHFIVNGVKKTAHFFSSEGGLLVWSFHKNPEDFSERFARKYASVPLLYAVPVNVMYGATILLGVLGFLHSKKNLLWWFACSLASSLIATHIVFYGGFRYHFPLMPFAALYAASISTQPFETFKQLTLKNRILFLALAVGLISVWVVEFITVYNAQ